MKKIEQQKSDHSNLRRYQLSAQIFILINRDVTFMRMTYSQFFEIRLKSIKFDENLINILIVTIFYSHISRFCFIRILFAYLSNFIRIFMHRFKPFHSHKSHVPTYQAFHYYTHILYMQG